MRKNAKTRSTRRAFIQHGLGTLAGLGLAAQLPTPLRASSKTKVRIGLLAPSHCALPAICAELAGFYRETGLSVELVFSPTMPDIAKGLLRGDLHFGQLMVPMAWAVHLGIGPFKGSEQPIVSPMWAGTNGGAMVVRKNSGIKVPNDLRGRIIGVHSRMMFHYLITKQLLERYRLQLDKDVTIKTIDMAEMITALQKKEIDAFINAEPLSSLAVAKGAGDDFLLTKDFWFRHPCCCITAKRTLMESEPAMFKDFVSGTMRGALQINATQTRMDLLRMVWEKSPPYKEVPLEVIQNAFTPGRTDFDPFPFQSSVKTVGRMLVQDGMLAPDTPVDEYAAQIFLSDYAREIMTGIDGVQVPAKNDRPERIFGKVS